MNRRLVIPVAATVLSAAIGVPAAGAPSGGVTAPAPGTATATGSAPAPTTSASTTGAVPSSTASDPTLTSAPGSTSTSDSEPSIGSTTGSSSSESESTAASDSSTEASPESTRRRRAIVIPSIPELTPIIASGVTIGISAPIVGPATITPGSTWTGTGAVTVIGTQGLLDGWTATARLSPLTGTRGAVLTPTTATYRSIGGGCSGGSGSTAVALSSSATVVRRAGAACVADSWTVTVSIAVPDSGVLADTYSGILTQSIA
ncbi:MAG: hypothetical protein NTW76_20520 [Corynebacteriales bacterium]|uniref:Uncharacterized protein n=1 Tax=Williamsia herbipolensis TaxID=1603258 RepID=A0AAU4K1D2_9NOCA|nr:hypothetical protein [Williamsia herbipolensis]MCX6471677.1 hypothetical protein [Mycobacteriales bacterium]